MRIKKYGLLLICLICLSLVVVGCGGQESGPAETEGSEKTDSKEAAGGEKVVLK